MPKFIPDFESVHAICPKPNCERTFLHRHHIGHEAIWVALNRFRSSRTTADKLGWTEEVIEAFEEDYHAFKEPKIGRLCAWHHAEIHLLYDAEIEKNQRRKSYKPLISYSYKEAQTLMKQLRKVYETWLAKETPGVSPVFMKGFRNFPLLNEEMKI